MCVCVREAHFQVKEIWDPNIQRKRRKVIFAEEECGDSSSSDYEDSNREKQEEHGDEDKYSLSFFSKDARAKSELTCNNAEYSIPPEKKLKLEEREEEMPAFADSEDELEMNVEEGIAGRVGASGPCSEEDETDSEDEEEDTDTIMKKQTTIMKKQTASEEKHEEHGKYTRL